MYFKKDIVDRYYNYIEKEHCYKISEELLGKNYFIAQEFGEGIFSRMKIEDGLDIVKINVDYKNGMTFHNKRIENNILEVGYCYGGNMEVISLPDNKKYIFKEGQCFIYKVLNDVESFKFKYNNFKSISIHVDFDAIKSTVNPIWASKLVDQWEVQLNRIFKEDILIIEKASYDIKEISEEIYNISTDDIMGYMKLKFKTIEFLATFLEEKRKLNFDENLNEYDQHIVIKAKAIINKNLQNPPSLKELASNLDISLYKLQQAFKNTTKDTTYEYIKKSRIEKAKYLLRNTQMSVIEIANEVGYENPSKFANLFKRYNNVTPLKYRKS